jgi:hypothetical protein
VVANSSPGGAQVMAYLIEYHFDYWCEVLVWRLLDDLSEEAKARLNEERQKAEKGKAEENDNVFVLESVATLLSWLSYDKMSKADQKRLAKKTRRQTKRDLLEQWNRCARTQ